MKQEDIFSKGINFETIKEMTINDLLKIEQEMKNE